MDPMLIALIVLSLLFDFLNGSRDSSNIVATMISSRSLAPRSALALTAVAEFCGPFIFGVAVANTIGSEIVVPNLITLPVLLAALISAIVWSLLTGYLGIPSSSSHALIGGLIGAVMISAGAGAIRLAGLTKILFALFLSPLLGLAAGFLFARLVYWLARNASMKINWFFKRAQLFTSVGLALSYGANDAQKTMGIITLGLVVSGATEHFQVPLWVIAVCSGAIAVGTSVGGWSLIKTLGGKFYRIRPVHSFCTQAASAAVILGAGLLGGPVSTTQVVSSTIMGVGSADRLNKVRWGVAGNILLAWLLTIPLSGMVGALVYLLLRWIVK